MRERALRVDRTRRTVDLGQFVNEWSRADALIIWSSNLVGSTPTSANSQTTGVDSQARRMLPMNVRGTAPGKVKWSYFGFYT